MLKKKEIQFIANEIVKFETVSEIIINEMEIKIVGRVCGGSYSAGLYRKNLSEISAHSQAEHRSALRRLAEFNK